MILQGSRFFSRLRAHQRLRSNWITASAAIGYHLSTSSAAENETSSKRKKRLDVAIVGLPNAGKSQLLNVLTGETVAAVSRKRHTTREGILGQRTVVKPTSATQLLFVDTPGFLRVQQARKEGIDRGVMGEAPKEIRNVDFSLLVVDAARNLTQDVKGSLVQLILQVLDNNRNDTNVNQDKDGKEGRANFAVVLNKVDLVHPKSTLLDTAMSIGELAEECISYQREEHSLMDKEDAISELMPMFFYISSLKNEGVDDVLNFLLDHARACESWDLDPNETTSMPPEERVEEVIREKIYRCLHKEVPYSVGQKNRLFRVVRGQSPDQRGLVIHQDLIVRTKSHKELLLGQGNQTLERIRKTAHRDLTRIFGCPIELHLHVKHNKSKQRNWTV